MARNAVQFQKGLSEPEFDRHYGAEEQCRAVVISARWPDGFWCPACTLNSRYGRPVSGLLHHVRGHDPGDGSGRDQQEHGEQTVPRH